MFNKSLVLCVRAYQVFISNSIGPCCRFYPSCSVYAIEALQRYNILKAIYLILRRLLRCNPFGKGGVDLLPNKTFKKS